MTHNKFTTSFLAALLGLSLAACSGDDGAVGPQGPPGQDGQDGQDGQSGPQGPGAVLPPGAGLKYEITSAGMVDGKFTVTFKATDAQGKAIPDAPTSAKPNFTLAKAASDGKLTSVITTAKAGANYGDGQTPALTSATQATADAGGTFAAAANPGEFTYQFKAAVAIDNQTNYQLAAYGSRSVDDVAYPAAAAFAFGPSAAIRQVVSDAACNACHGNLTAHGSRRTVAVCATCHEAQTVDPETGDSVDFAYMAHKIHSGADYTIVGYRQTVYDFSHVTYPGNLKSCTTCHQGADAANYKTKPTRAACGSCHTGVDFATGEGHYVSPTTGRGIIQTNDNNCALCHDDAAIEGYHAISTGHAVALEVLEVTSANPGEAPTLKFKVLVDGAPADLIAKDLANLEATLAGPTSDYAWYKTTKIADATLTKVEDGVYEVQLSTLPDDASGSYAVWMAGYEKFTAGTTTVTTLANNAVAYQAVSGGAVVPRKTVVEQAKCNACHYDLGFHSSSMRKDVNYCAACHNANNDNADRVPLAEGESKIPESVHFKVMIHKIHMGEKLTADEYVLGTHSGSHDFKETVFPNQVQNCENCHAKGTYSLPLENRIPTQRWLLECTELPDADTDDTVCDPATARVQDLTTVKSTLPETAACTSCHDSDAAFAHAATNTFGGLEACATCHGTGKTWDAAVVHVVAP